MPVARCISTFEAAWRAQLNTSGPVLVVAPDEGLRRSIAFALEVEGWSVLLSNSLAMLPNESHREPVGCAVIDDGAIASGGGDWDQIAGLAAPVILLVDDAKAVPATFAGSVLRKPLLGVRLVEAVAEAVARNVPSK